MFGDRIENVVLAQFQRASLFATNIKEYVHSLISEYRNAKIEVKEESTVVQIMEDPSADQHANGYAHGAMDISRGEETSTTTQQDVPKGWHLMEACLPQGLPTLYVRLVDGIVASLADAIELNVSGSSVVKQEYCLLAPAVVKFYQDRVSACTDRQAKDLCNGWWEFMETSERQSEATFVSVHMYRSPTTLPVSIELSFHPTTKRVTMVSKKHVHTQNGGDGTSIVDTYDIPVNPDHDDQFPTLLHIIKHVPGIYQHMSCTLTNDKTHGSDVVMIKDSPFSINTRAAIIEIDNEEAELAAKLEMLRKRKRELEELQRNVRPSY